MRVAIVTEQLLAPVPGGVGRYSAELAAALARVGDAADTVTGWTAWHNDVRAAVIAGAHGPRRLPLGRRALAVAWARGLGPVPHAADLVHAPSPLHPPPGRVPLVVTVHDTVPWTHPETLTPHGARWHRAMAERAVNSGATIAVPTNVVGDELRAALPALRADRVAVLGGGVAPALLDEPDAARRAAVRRRLALPDRYLLTLATLEPRKGLDVLVEALARLGRDAPPLLIAGQPGWGGVDVGAAAARAGVSDGAVRVLGRIDDDSLGVVLRDAVALVAPSRTEGFGLPVAEAMAVGTAVICSDAPALVEVSAGAAIVVPAGDDRALAVAISGLLGDDPLRQRLVRAGREHAARYDWNAVAGRAWELYRGLVPPTSR